MNAIDPALFPAPRPLAGKTVALTGASGALGPTLAEALAAAGARVIGLGRDPARLAARCPGIEHWPNERLGELLAAQPVDTIVDLAVANNAIRASDEEFREANVHRLMQLIAQAEAADVPQVIAVSTQHALDPDQAGGYARSKREARALVLARADSRVRLLTLPKVTLARPGTAAGLAWAQAAVIKPATHASAVGAALTAMIAEGPSGLREVFVASAADPRTRQLASRVLDYAAALGIVIGFGWLMLLLAVAIRLDSPGPAIFAQRRVGKDEKPFTLYKFRTMSVGTREAGTHEITASSVTRAGAILRRLKLDELPQAFNILRGELSLVGPRPCLPVQRELVAARRAAGIYSLRPGLTGLAQVNGIDMSDPARLVEWEARYLQLRGLALDLRIVMQTFLGRGGGDRTSA